MKLLGRDISTSSVLAAVNERLFARGLSGAPDASEVTAEGIEGRIDPMSFYVTALGDHAESSRGLPLETHRGGVAGRAVMLAKTMFRRAGQIFINEALSRQVVFNGHVRDSYAQLSAEVMKLKEQMAGLEKQLAAKEALLRRAQTKPVQPAKGPAPAPVSAKPMTAKFDAAPVKGSVAAQSKAAAKARKIVRTPARRSSKS